MLQYPDSLVSTIYEVDTQPLAFRCTLRLIDGELFDGTWLIQSLNFSALYLGYFVCFISRALHLCNFEAVKILFAALDRAGSDSSVCRCREDF